MRNFRNRDGTTAYATLATWNMLRLGTITESSQRLDARRHRAFVCVGGIVASESRESTTMKRVARTGDEKRILLVLLLRLVGDFRKILAPLRVTPSQAGVLLFLRHHPLSRTVTALVQNGWVAKRRAVKDDRVAVLSLTRRGHTLARHMEQRVRHVEATLTERKVPL